MVRVEEADQQQSIRMAIDLIERALFNPDRDDTGFDLNMALIYLKPWVDNG